MNEKYFSESENKALQQIIEKSSVKTETNFFDYYKPRRKYMSNIIRYIKQLFCDHIYGDGVINPFVDECGNHSANYYCEKCGHRYFKTFRRK